MRVTYLGPADSPPTGKGPVITVLRKRMNRLGAYAAETRRNNLAGPHPVCIVASHAPGGLEDAIKRASNYAENSRVGVIYVRDELSDA
jgi:hypothetical protein